MCDFAPRDKFDPSLAILRLTAALSGMAGWPRLTIINSASVSVAEGGSAPAESSAPQPPAGAAAAFTESDLTGEAQARRNAGVC